MPATQDTVKQLRKMAKETPAHAFFGWLAEYRNNGNNSVDQAAREAMKWGRANLDPQLAISRTDVIAIMKGMEELQLGRFIVGRRGADSRFEFWRSRGQIGQAAIGKTAKIDMEEEAVSLDDEAIIEAHRLLLAHALGRSASAISIHVKD